MSIWGGDTDEETTPVECYNRRVIWISYDANWPTCIYITSLDLYL